MLDCHKHNPLGVTVPFDFEVKLGTYVVGGQHADSIACVNIVH